MKKIIIREKEYDLIEGWNEITLGNYINLVELYNKRNDLLEEQFLIKFIPLISNLNEEEVMNCYEEDLLPFVSSLKNFTLETFIKEEKRQYIFNNNLYSVVIPNKLTMGENTSIKLLEKSSKDIFDSWLNMLTILIRPATEITNEFGEKEYIVEPFNGDQLTLMRRKELFKDIKAVNAMWILESFTAGRK